MRVIVLVDLMTLIYPLVAQHKHHEFLSVHWGKLLKGWYNKVSQPILWLPKLTGKVDRVDIVFAVDHKLNNRYWRHDHLKGYKSSRKITSDLIAVCKERITTMILDRGGTILQAPGFEADDWAGEVSRALGTNDRLFMVTVDTDWGQLINDRVIWLDTYCSTQRKNPDQKSLVLDAELLVRRINAYRDNESFQIEHPRELVDLKWTLGDRSDKIPAGNLPGLREIIDLYNPGKYPVPISLNEIQPRLDLYPGVPDLPMHILGLPTWKDYQVNLQNMTVTEVP